MNKTEVIDKFKKLLDESSSESEIQEFLEQHSQLLPEAPFMRGHFLSPMDCIITKLKLGNRFTTDFAYVTKDSLEWNIVLIEIESPKKKIFKNSGNSPRFTSAFNEALQQIKSWKGYLDQKGNKEKVISALQKFFEPAQMASNVKHFKYCLIYGRNSELNSDERNASFKVERTNDISIMTYDSILHEYEHRPETDFDGYIVVSLNKETCIKIKCLPDGYISTGMFTCRRPSEVEMSKEQMQRFIDEGFDMDAWRQGKFLTINEKHPSERLGV